MKNSVKAVRLSQTALKTKATKVLYALKRDASDLRKYGVTAQMIADFETKVNNLHATGPDSDWRSLLSIAVSDFDTAKIDLLKTIKVIGFNLKLNGNSQSVTYAGMQIQNMTSLDNVDLERAVSSLIQTLDTNHDEMIAAGVTDEQIAELKTADNNFVSKMAAKLNASQVRKTTTENRNKDYVEVYDLAVKYAEIGKELWKDISPAKYRDYVLLISSADKASPPVTNGQATANQNAAAPATSQPIATAENTSAAKPAEAVTTVVGTVETETKAS